MPVCPFGPHRLRLDTGGRCQGCGSDLAAYAALRDLAGHFYNEGRRRWDAEDLPGAAAWLQASLHLRADLPEPHWLLGLVRLRQDQPEAARASLLRARSLGAKLDLDDADLVSPAAGARSAATVPADDAPPPAPAAAAGDATPSWPAPASP